MILMVACHIGARLFYVYKDVQLLNIRFAVQVMVDLLEFIVLFLEKCSRLLRGC